MRTELAAVMYSLQNDGVGVVAAPSSFEKFMTDLPAPYKYKKATSGDIIVYDPALHDGDSLDV